MSNVDQLWQLVTGFINGGGWVLWLILLDCFLLLTLIIEAYWSATINFNKTKQQLQNQWQQRNETHSWFAQNIRKMVLSKAHLQFNQSQPYIKMLIFICPLLGLLGTVSGMIEVFDVLAVTGTGNARAMAAGIGKATIPTMAGMVVAIIGLFLQTRLSVLLQKRDEQLASLLFFNPKSTEQ